MNIKAKSDEKMQLSDILSFGPTLWSKGDRSQTCIFSGKIIVFPACRRDGFEDPTELSVHPDLVLTQMLKMSFFHRGDNEFSFEPLPSQAQRRAFFWKALSIFFSLRRLHLTDKTVFVCFWLPLADPVVPAGSQPSILNSTLFS